jgi:predicted nucleotidyltransferase
MIEKLFTSRNRVKLLEFFLIRKGSGRLREISKLIGVSPSFLSKELKNLFVIGLINLEKGIYSENEKCIFVEDVRNLILKTDGLVFPIKEVIEKNKLIRFAFIFGSYANGKFGNNSDVDLMIIGNVSLNEVIIKLSIIEKKIKRDINPIIWKMDNLKKEKKQSFVRDIFSKKIIMIKGDENELRKFVR